MFVNLLRRLSDWVGDRHLDTAIRDALRRDGYGVHMAAIRDVRLSAVERPGWVQVYTFWVETTDAARQPIEVFGVSLNDGRQIGTEVFLSPDPMARDAQFAQWSTGMTVR
ncbi:hypothetical protein Pla175_34280 [Pirellulimonas nuda]|uniref:Uncharacterized protein n=1 Tax=Pirellulimonas nuda TaxID=2528009 RepID=A0A518DEY1_9BACT|nr:hypothetical protein [Pirellulimonas nuda]QDU90029.1 hypothetical protein Pla175_34280 [Pirellulimonas nuda]